MTDADPGTTVTPQFSGDGEPLKSTQLDLFGMWLAAIPMVTWGAPLGSSFAARVSARTLVLFVAVLAALETVSTIIFLDELRTNPALAVYAVLGAVVLFGALGWIARNRGHVLGLPGVALEASLTRRRLDVSPDYSDALRKHRPRRGIREPMKSACR